MKFWNIVVFVFENGVDTYNGNGNGGVERTLNTGESVSRYCAARNNFTLERTSRVQFDGRVCLVPGLSRCIPAPCVPRRSAR